MTAQFSESPPSARSPLRRHEVTEQIRQAILDLRVKPGQRLVEREVVEWTNSSRATVREAIRELAKEGLVELIPMKGAIVAKPTVEEIRKIYEVRTLLEGFATRLFTEHATDEEVRALRAVVNELEAIIRRETVSEKLWDFYSMKNRYYEVILGGTRNPFLNEMVSDVLKRMVAVRVGYFSLGLGGEATMKEIREVMEAVEARDPAAAEDAARRHVEIRGSGNLLSFAMLYDEMESGD